MAAILLLFLANLSIAQLDEDINLADPYLLEKYDLNELLQYYSFFDLKPAIDAYQDKRPWIIKGKGFEADGWAAMKSAINHAREYLELTFEESRAIDHALSEMADIPELALRHYEQGCRILLQNMPPSQEIIEEVAALINKTDATEKALYSEIYNELLTRLGNYNRDLVVNQKEEVHSRMSSTNQDYLIWAQHEPQEYLELQIPACQRFGSPRDVPIDNENSGFFTNDGETFHVFDQATESE